MDFKGKVFKFFVTPVYPYGNDHYYHEMIALAEGLIERGYKVISNVDYWWQPEKNEFLLKGDLDADFDIGVYCRRFVLSFEHLLFRKDYPNFNLKKIHVVNDRNDWLSPIWNNNKHYQLFDLILAGSLVKGLPVPSNVKPWAIGFTNRTIELTDRYFTEREEPEPVIGHNFRVSHNLRKLALEKLKQSGIKIPIKESYTDNGESITSDIDKYYFKATTKRQHPQFFQMLDKQLLFLTFCGYTEFKPMAYQPYGVWDKIVRKPWYWLSKMVSDPNITQFVFQHDSFRFWEALYSKTCPIALDYHSHGFILPVMPTEGEHYLGVKNFNFSEFATRINKTDITAIKQIGLNGRTWVSQHYSPVAQADRFLTYLSDIKK